MFFLSINKKGLFYGLLHVKHDVKGHNHAIIVLSCREVSKQGGTIALQKVQ